MYVAKGEGKNRAVSFETRMHDRAVDRLSVSAELIRGIENGELFVEYQPIQRISTGAVLAAEALVRWRHPTRGVLPPGMFIPIAEESTAISSLGRFVLDSAIAAVAEWRLEDPAMRVTVNLSARQLHESTFIPDLADCLQRHDVSGDALILELTETVLADDRVFARLGALGELGIALAIDDFGTGYSSLAYLQQFSVSYLKIDRSFIVDVDHDPQRRALVAAVVNMARTLDIEPVAEGVETEAQLRALIELGCDLAQGYHLGRPAEGYAIVD
jgi:EAL domain-containing protein (putative c-di-GMP-specific phosphodiesterase class I)